MRVEETFGFVLCVVKTGALKSIQGYAANILHHIFAYLDHWYTQF